MTDSRRLLLTVLLVAGCSSRSIPAPLHHLFGVSSPSPVQNPPLGNPAIVWNPATGPFLYDGGNAPTTIQNLITGCETLGRGGGQLCADGNGGVSLNGHLLNPQPDAGPYFSTSVKIDAGVSAFTLCTAAGKCVNVKAIADYILDAGLNGT